MSSFTPNSGSPPAEDTIPSPFPPFRRIITSHTKSDKDGDDVLIHDDTYALQPVLGGRAHVGYIFASKDVPTSSRHHISQEDIKETIGDCSGVVYPGGVNGQITDLPPDCGVGMHRTNSIDYNIFLHGSAWLITPTKDQASTPSSQHSTANGVNGDHKPNGVNGVNGDGAASGVGHPDAKPGEVWTEVKAGQVVVQRGTMHAWKAGKEGARWCTVVIAAKPVVLPSGEELPERDFD